MYQPEKRKIHAALNPQVVKNRNGAVRKNDFSENQMKSYTHEKDRPDKSPLSI
jgi:hypothetical protein